MAGKSTQNTMNSLENIMDGINTSVYVIDSNTFKLLFVNKWLKAFYGRENEDFTGKFCYKAFRNNFEVCSFCPCKRLKENPEQTVVWEEFLEPYGIYVRHSFCYINWPNGEKVILHYGVDTTDIHEKMELLVKLEKQERELVENRISIMLSQIQPHFLYNTLVVIRTLCRIDPKMAEETVVEFSDYLRSNMDSLLLKEPIPFEKELRHVETYLKIEKKRFGDKLNVSYNIKVKDFMIPALTLQPIVENAVRYGVTQKENGGTIEIKTEETETSFIVHVIDDGVGFNINEKPKDDERHHIGIDNTRSRLEQMCSGTLDIQSKVGIGTTAVITIPKQ